MASALQVAQWMVGELNRVRTLYQEQAVWDIQQEFGSEHVYENKSGNMAISKPVLAEFRKLCGDTVIWSRGERFWRFREEFDEAGRLQV